MNKLLPFLVVSLIFTSTAGWVHAAEIVISGNGSESVNSAGANVVTETSVDQNNQAQVNNDINSNANSGDNTAFGNSGNVSVDTGNATTNTTVNNSGNTSVADLNCCPNSQTTNITITDNGSGSTNNITTSIVSNTAVNVNNTANVNNYITGNVNTGGNTANSNAGSVTIETGNAVINTWLSNQLNSSIVKAPIGINTTLVLNIKGNAAGSTNNIDVNLESKFLTYVNNLTNLNNILNNTANTGNNSANGNLGDVSIKTGDAKVNVNIVNDVNDSAVEFECCEGDHQPPTPTPCTENCDNHPSPNNPPSGGNGGGGGGGGGGGSSSGPAVLGSAGQILPVTGSNWIVILTLASLLMFLLGLYLRLHPGQDPGKILA